MKRLPGSVRWLMLIAILFVAFSSGCKAHSTTTPPVKYSIAELKYILVADFGDVFWCDPDTTPVAIEGREQTNALEQFPAIKSSVEEFTAILHHLGLPDKAEYTDEEKLQIYRQHKLLTYGIQLTASGDIYNFTLRKGFGQGQRFEGTITQSGKTTILTQEPSVNTCPICLTAGTLIDRPGGTIPVEHLREGMIVWTIDGSGNNAAAVVIETIRVPVPDVFSVIRLTLSDGRSVMASAGHPTAGGRALGTYKVGDTLDGAAVSVIENVTCVGGATYDILPSGGTGLYRANGILLRSTLVKQ